MDINVKIPASFEWVVNWLKRWNEENKRGEIRLEYKNGGVSKMWREELEMPDKQE